MGSPRKIRKKYSTPTHPWNLATIEEERVLTKEYGLRNKKEIYKMRSLLRKFRSQAKKLTADNSKQSQKEEKQLLDKLIKLNLLKPGSAIDAILDLTIEDIMNRRLQTIVYKHNLAKTIKQARQFIIHHHIFLGNKKLTVPSYIVSAEEESQITFDPSSELSKEDHPERITKEPSRDKIDKQIEKEEKQGLGELKEEEKEVLRDKKKQKEDWKKESEEIKEKEELLKEDQKIIEETEKEIEKEEKEELPKEKQVEKPKEKGEEKNA